MADSQQLSYSQCEAVLRAGVVGRVAVWADDEPHVMPMNYSVVDEAIIMCTTLDGVLGRHARGAKVAFEVDYFDYGYHRGVSVVARGVIEVVEDPGEMAHIRSVWAPRPWAGGDRSLVLRLRWSTLTGRQLGSGWDPMSVLPVRRTI
jgi:uncharacterized protein